MEDKWISSGKFGSKDAVLIFRTSILNADREDNSKDGSSTLPLRGSSGNVSCTKKAPSSVQSDRVRYLPVKTDNKENERCNDCIFLKNQLPSIKMCSNQSIRNDNKHFNINLDNIPRVKNYLSFSYIGNSNTNDYERLVYMNECENASDFSKRTAFKLPNQTEENENEGLKDIDLNIVDEPFSPHMPAYVLKLKYKFMHTETKLLRKIFVRHGMTEVESNENFSILWTGLHMKPDILRNLAPYQRVNHFPRSYELTRKDRLYKNIERMQHLRGMKYFDIVPQSFVLPLEYKDLLVSHNKCRGPWIVKPAASSRGRGIFIVNSPDQIPQDEQNLVSKYIKDPLCIDGHKCDLRVYVLVTSFDPLIVYLYKEGIVRIATVKYDQNSDSFWNPCMHLCNYSINKYHSDYIKSNDVGDEDVGHKWTLSALLRHLRSQGCDTQQLMVNIEDVVIKAFLSCAESIISACRMFVPNGNNCFELYGFDILIDDSLKPWLLEVNLSPSIGVDSPLDTKVKACLLTDLLTCVGIPALSPAMRAHYDNKWSRFLNISCSRHNSSARPKGSKQRNSTHASPLLTLEEQRIIRNARFQNARRGGFVRIFPTYDSMHRYSIFLDAATGIPLSTSEVLGQQHFIGLLSHNYNQMLYNSLYGKESQDKGNKEGNSIGKRMSEYESPLPADSSIVFKKKTIAAKCTEKSKRLRNKILQLFEGGSELSVLQARQAFSLYLDSVHRRLTEEPKEHLVKLILKFLNKIGSNVKAPWLNKNTNPQNLRTFNKARNAMIAKLLYDFLEQYNRETDSYVDTFDHYGMIPSNLFNEFLTQAQESDLESVLTMSTNITGTMPYLYNRFGLSVPPTPPIPSGVHGFLRALPSMVTGGYGARDYVKYENHYHGCEKYKVNFKNQKFRRTISNAD